MLSDTDDVCLHGAQHQQAAVIPLSVFPPPHTFKVYCRPLCHYLWCPAQCMLVRSENTLGRPDIAICGHRDRFSAVSIFFMLIFETETKHEWGRGRERERGRHRVRSRLQALSCQHRARRAAWTHEPWNHDLSRSQALNRLSHPGAPLFQDALNWVLNPFIAQGCSIKWVSTSL